MRHLKRLQMAVQERIKVSSVGVEMLIETKCHGRLSILFSRLLITTAIMTWHIVVSYATPIFWF